MQVCFYYKIKLYHFETMEKIGDTLNKLIIDTWGGLIAFWLLVVAFAAKFFTFVGKCAARGLVSELVNAITPAIKGIISEEIESETKPIKKALKLYKDEKHKQANELNILRGAVIFDDKEYLKEYKKYYENKSQNS